MLLARLGILAAWSTVTWNRGRRAAVGGLMVGAMLSKASWVVTPMLVWELEVAVRRRPPRASAQWLPVGVPVVDGRAESEQPLPEIAASPR